MAESSFDTFCDDLLIRVAAIQESINVAYKLDGAEQTVTVKASPYYFLPLEQDGFPVFRNRIAPSNSDHTQGHPLRRDTITVEMSLIAGPAATGYVSEYEQKLNQLYMPVLNRFAKSLKLEIDGAALRYVQSALILSHTGTIGFRIEEGGALLFGSRFILQVISNFQVPRR